MHHPPRAPSSPLTVTSSRAGALPSPTPGCTQRCQAPPDHERASRPWGRPGCSWRLCPCSALAVVFALDLNRSAERFVGRKWSQLLSLLITWRQIARRVEAVTGKHVHCSSSLRRVFLLFQPCTEPGSAAPTFCLLQNLVCKAPGAALETHCAGATNGKD